MFDRIEIRRNHRIVDEIFKIAKGANCFICGGFARVCCSAKEKPMPDKR